jgi:hypothetical protein
VVVFNPSENYMHVGVKIPSICKNKNVPNHQPGDDWG